MVAGTVWEESPVLESNCDTKIALNWLIGLFMSAKGKIVRPAWSRRSQIWYADLWGARVFD